MPKIVIVDDQATDRQILGRLTRNLATDIEVQAFGCPRDALAWLEQHQPDLILLDYRMPDMDGMAFVEALKELPTCTGVPVVVITIIDDADLRYRALAAGATDFLTKPLDLKECEARCRNLLTLREQQLVIARHAERLAEARERTGRVLRTLTLSNTLLIGPGTDQELIRGVCRVIAQQAGYPLVRVGLWDDREQLHEVASCVRDGLSDDDASLSSLNADGDVDAIRRTGQARIINELADDTVEPRWRETLRAAGCGAAVPAEVSALVR